MSFLKGSFYHAFYNVLHCERGSWKGIGWVRKYLQSPFEMVGNNPLDMYALQGLQRGCHQQMETLCKVSQPLC